MILQKLRRYQKRILIPLAVVVTTVMVFSMGDVRLRDLFSGSRDPVVIPGTGYRRSDLELTVLRLRAAAPGYFSYAMQGLTARHVDAWLFEATGGRTPPDRKPTVAQFAAFLSYLVPIERAREAGLTVSDAQLAKDIRERIDFMVVRQDESDRAKAYSSHLRENRLTRVQFERTRRDILLLTKYQDLIRTVAGAPASIEDAYLQHCMDVQTVDLDVIAFAVKEFEDQIDEVTIEGLRGAYARRVKLPRTRPYRPSPRFPNFVMQRPVPDALYTEPLARVEYLLAETADFEKGVSIEPQEIADHYDEHKDTDFRAEPEKEEKKEESEGAEKAEEKPEEKPEKSADGDAPALKPLDEVRDEIVRRLTKEKASEAAKKALEDAVKAYNAGASLRETLIDHGPPRPGGEEAALAGAPSRPASGKEEKKEEEKEEKPEEKPARALSLAEVAKTYKLSTGRTDLLDEEAMKELPVFEGIGYGGGVLSSKVFGETPEARSDIVGRLSEAKKTKAGHVAVTLRAHHAARKQTFAEAREKLGEDLAVARARSLARKACTEAREKLVAGAGAPAERVKKEKSVEARGHFRAAALLSVGQVSEPTYDGDEKAYRLLVLTARTVPDRAAFLKDRLAVERARRTFTQGLR